MSGKWTIKTEKGGSGSEFMYRDNGSSWTIDKNSFKHGDTYNHIILDENGHEVATFFSNYGVNKVPAKARLIVAAVNAMLGEE